jgi:uncharacterized membrane protein YgaE (UPF0421/DUF939 family)
VLAEAGAAVILPVAPKLVEIVDCYARPAGAETMARIARRFGPLAAHSYGAGRTWWPIVVHSFRTAVSAVVSVLVARLFRLPEAYWAPITTFVITQSSLGTALAVSWQRFLGTLLGAVIAGIAASYFAPTMMVFGASVFILGLLCAVVRSHRSAYRFAGVTLAIILLIPRPGPAWIVAFHRFAEVSIGIGVALVLAMVWPEREDTPSDKS